MKFTIVCLTAATLFFGAARQPVLAQSALEKLEKKLESVLPPPASDRESKGDGEPGYVGVFVDEPAEGAEGLTVSSTTKGGPADAAGLKPGDQILSVNRQPLRSTDDMAKALQPLRAGEEVIFEVLRGGIAKSLTVRLVARPKIADKPKDVFDPAPRTTDIPEVRRAPAGTVTPRGSALGVRVIPVTEQARLTFGLPVTRGAVITKVYADSPAERAGLTVGSAIVAVNGRRVDSSAELISMMKGIAPGTATELTYYQGPRLGRKMIVVGEQTVASRPVDEPRRPTADEGPAVERRGLFGRRPAAGRRPALERLEAAIDLFAPEITDGLARPPERPVADPSETIELRARVEQLERQIELLQQKIKELQTPPPAPREVDPDA